MELDIPFFKPECALPHRQWLILGPRGTGKSVMLLDLLRKTGNSTEMSRDVDKPPYDYARAFTATVSTAHELEKYIPSAFVHRDGYDFDVADRFLEDAVLISSPDHNVEYVSRRRRRGLLVMDDCMFDNRVMQTQTQRCLALNARHYKLTVFNTTQYAMAVPPVIRANIDYVIALRDTTVANRKKLYEHYYGCFSSFQQFEQVFAAVTANFGALVLDRTAASGNLEDQIRWYRADSEAKPCRILQQSFFDIAEMDQAIGWKTQDTSGEISLRGTSMQRSRPKRRLNPPSKAASRRT